MANSQDTKLNRTGETGQPVTGTTTPPTGGMGTNTGDGLSGAATATARSFYDQAKETAGKAYEAVTDKTAQKLDEQKSTLSGGLATVADSVRQVSDNLGSAETDSGLAETAAKYTDTAARRIEDIAGYFERKSVREMAHDLEGFARRNPAIFLGAAFGVGLLLARFLKSTPPSDFGSYDRQLGSEMDSGRNTANQPSGMNTASGTSGASSGGGENPGRGTSGASTRNTSSTSDSIANPM